MWEGVGQWDRTPEKTFSKSGGQRSKTDVTIANTDSYLSHMGVDKPGQSGTNQERNPANLMICNRLHGF